MNSEKLLHLITNPNAVSKETTIALESVLDEFPYFQMARVLHLKGLKNQNSFKYNKELKKTAAFTTNRTVLFDFITTNTLDFETVSKSEKNILNEIDVIDSKVIDHLHKSIIASENNNDILKELNQFNKLNFLNKVTNFKEENSISELKIDGKIIEEKSEKNKILGIGEPINFKKDDSFSFNQWLQLKSIKPIKRETEILRKVNEEKNEQKSNAKSQKTEHNEIIKSINEVDLIAQFIKNKPKIQPTKNQLISDVSISGLTENTNLMTETLARVYLEQKKYKKAIAAFKILSLKYPEKSSFFANQIKAIVFLENNKS